MSFFRLILCSVAAVLVTLTAGAAENAPAKSTNAVEKLIRQYRATSKVAAKVGLLRKIGEAKGERVEEFLEDEYNSLDSTTPEEARLLGVIFEAWARQPTEETLHHLIFQGIFHDETNVVFSSTMAIVKMSEEARGIMIEGNASKGKDPSEDLAADFINRMLERPEFILAIERVLVILSRQPRTGFNAEAKLDTKVDAATRKAALEHWKAWFAKRYGKPFVPEPPQKP
jgi:hypothetical protein